MAIPKFEADLNIISKLPNYPGSEGGLTPEEFKAKFDEAALLLQEYLNEVLIPEANATVDVDALLAKILDPTLTASNMAARADAVGAAIAKLLPLAGGTMTGALNVLEPTAEGHAANKNYVDTKVAGAHLEAQVTVVASGWSASAPYTQAVNVNGILATDRVHWGVVYSGDADAMLAQKEAFAMVDDLDSAAGKVTFTCFEEKPEVSLTIALEVNR
jgi:hypothetical protein